MEYRTELTRIIDEEVGGFNADYKAKDLPILILKKDPTTLKLRRTGKKKVSTP